SHCFLNTHRPPHRSTLFPYTTLFRSLKEVKPHIMTVVPRLLEKVYDKIYTKGTELKGIRKKLFFWALDLGFEYEPYGANGSWYRSEEHTSELQSRENLVCRLLLEKKK